MKKIVIYASLTSVILLQSCALILSGGKDKIKVNAGNPSTAKVYYNGNEVGTGDCSVKVRKKSLNSAVIEVKAEGYETQTFRFSRKLKKGAVLLDCLTGFIWLIPDFATGAIYKAKPQSVHYDLQIANSAIKTDLKVGDKVTFTHGDYKNEDGEIKILYPNRAVVKYIKKNGKEIEMEVPLINISKK